MKPNQYLCKLTRSLVFHSHRQLKLYLKSTSTFGEISQRSKIDTAYCEYIARKRHKIKILSIIPRHVKYNGESFMTILKGDQHVIRTFYSACLSSNGDPWLRQRTHLYPNKAVPVSLSFLSFSMGSIKVTTNEKVQICEVRLLVKPFFYFCLDTKQTMIVDDFAAPTGKAYCSVRKGRHFDHMKANSRSNADTMIFHFISELCVLKFAPARFLN